MQMMDLCNKLHSTTNAVSLTNSMLDANSKIRQDGVVKRRTIVGFLMLLAVALLSSGCKPQGPNIEELTELQKRNASLRREIADMQMLIRRAGEDVPNLQDQIDARNQEVVQAYETLKQLQAQETDVRMRRIELEGRLDRFRETFRSLQSQVLSSNKSQP